MNTISIKKNVLEKALSNIQSATNKKDLMDITSSIMFETSGDQLILRATDNEVFIKITLKLDSIEGAFNCAVNGELINNIIKPLSDDEIIMEETETLLLVKQKKACFEIPFYDTGNFPFKYDYKDMEKIEIDNELFLQGIKRISHCCAEQKDLTPIAMQGILIEIKNKLFSLVATDTRRMAFIRREYHNEVKNISCILPKKAISEISKLFSNQIEVYIKRRDGLNEGESENNIEGMAFIYEDKELYTRLINAKFPAYEKIINKERKTQCIRIKKAEFIKSINQINAVSKRVKISFEKDKILFEAINDDKLRASVSIDYQTNIEEEGYVALVNKNMIDCISNSKVEEFDLYLSDPDSPILMNFIDFEEIVMPQLI